MLFAVDLHEDFIDVEDIATAPVLSLQAAGINGSELDTPEANRFSADGDASLSPKVFNEWSGTPAMAEIESVVEPNCVTDDDRWEPIALVSIHAPILSILGS